jgi:hypothetical protein
MSAPMIEWYVMIYEKEHHTNPKWTYTVQAEGRLMAIISGLCLFRNDKLYHGEFNRVEAIPL